jgi:hypothetical protein
VIVPTGDLPADPTDAPVDADASVDEAAGDQWGEILAMFVDDPRGSVAEASVLVGEAIEALVATAHQRQASLAASWQAEGADTEQLRQALQDYRAFWARLVVLGCPDAHVHADRGAVRAGSQLDQVAQLVDHP